MAEAKDFTQPIIEVAGDIAGKVSARVLFAYADAVGDLVQFAKSVKSPTKLVLITRQPDDAGRCAKTKAQLLDVPNFSLTRMGQIKVATLMAFSQGLLTAGDVFVFLTGASGHGIDTLVVMEVGQEYELFQSVDQPKLTEHIKRVVFQRALTLLLELAHEGREGKSIGTLFVLGDQREVQKYCQQNIINPFKGYPEKQRNILDDNMRETIKEFAYIDGAFVVKGNGTIVSAGTTLLPAATADPLPAGLGTRHATAAAITANTKSVAMTLSESTQTIRIWRRGRMITEIEKAARAPANRPQSPDATLL